LNSLPFFRLIIFTSSKPQTSLQPRFRAVPKAWKRFSSYKGIGGVELHTTRTEDLPDIIQTNPLWTNRVACLSQNENGSFEACFTTLFLAKVQELVQNCACVALIASMMGTAKSMHVIILFNLTHHFHFLLSDQQIRGKKLNLNLLLDPSPNIVGAVFVVVEYDQAIKYMSLLQGISTRSAATDQLPDDVSRHFIVVLPPAVNDKKRGRRWGLPCTRDRAHAFLSALAKRAQWDSSKLFVAVIDDDVPLKVVKYTALGEYATPNCDESPQY